MDIQIKKEPVEAKEDLQCQIKVEIKEENELLIENEGQWQLTKSEDEENEYYKEFVADYGQDECSEAPAENESVPYEHYTIQYIDENQYYDDDDDEEINDVEDNDYCEESDGSENSGDEDGSGMDFEYNLELNDHDNQKQKKEESLSSLTKDFCKFRFNKWLYKFYVKRECPACQELFAYHIEWHRHITAKHKDLIKASESNYFISDNCGVCKKCNREFVTEIARYLHSIRHTEDGAKLYSNICKICNFVSPRNKYLHGHIAKEHPEVVENFNKSVSKNNPFICPICASAYNQYKHLSYHIMDKHPNEYYAKYLYNCHLCEHDEFNEEEPYLLHLMEKHELNSWNSLNYRKIFEDKEYFACLKCHRVLIENDNRKLIKHYLQHEDNCYWKCKFCSRKTIFKKFNHHHMCLKMMRYFAKQKKDAQKNGSEATVIDEKEKSQKLKNLQEFEDYITHICPFCKEEFDKMMKWQQHLRKEHDIDSLRGLQMKVIPGVNNKLRCVICHTMVSNTSGQLHAHRFLHLPYQPYKCRHCSHSLNTFKMALNHVLKRCNDEEDRDYIKKILIRQTNRQDAKAKVFIQCPICNYQKFNDTPSILKHLEEEHNNFEDFFVEQPDSTRSCKVCQKQLKKYGKTSSLEHVHYHFEEKFFKCPLCVNSYRSFKSTYNHLLSYHFAKSLSQIQSVEKANIHKNFIYLNEKDKVTIKTESSRLAKPSLKSHVLNEFVEFITFACPECNEGMTNQEDWHNHIITKHNFFDKSNLYFKDTDGSVKCPTCKLKLVTNPTQQQKHKLTHMPYRSFICTLCYTRCNSLGVLYGHFRRRHFAPGSFECPLCSEILPSEYQRTDHIKKQHPRNEWPGNMCLICYKLLSNNSGLISHMITHDLDRVKHTCEFCGAKLVGIKDFNTHVARHVERGESKKQDEIDENDISSQSSSKNIKENVTEVNEQDKDLCAQEDYKEIYKSEDNNCNKRKSRAGTLSTKKKKNKK